MKTSGGIFEKNKITSKLKDLDKALTAENFWKDKNKVKKTVKEKKIFETILKSFKETSTEIGDLKDKLRGYEEMERNLKFDEEIIKSEPKIVTLKKQKLFVAESSPNGR